MQEDQKLDAKSERASGKSGSAEEIGFGLAQKDKSNDGKNAVGGREGGRQERLERGGERRGRDESGTGERRQERTGGLVWDMRDTEGMAMSNGRGRTGEEMSQGGRC